MHGPVDDIKVAAVNLIGARRYHPSANPAEDNSAVARWLAAFEQVAFDRLTIDDLLISGPAAGGNSAIRIERTAIDRFDRGALDGAFMLAGLRMDVTGASKTSMSLDSLEIAHPNLKLAANWRDAVAGTAGLTPDSALPMLDSMTLKGWSATTRGPISIKLDALHLDAIRLYPASWAKNGGPAILEEMGHFPPKPGVTPEPLQRLDAAGLLSFGLSGAIDGFESRLEVPGNVGGRIVNKIAHGRIVNYDRCRLENGSLDKFEAEVGTTGTAAADNVFISTDHIEAKILDMRDTCARFAAGAPPDASLLDSLTLAGFENVGTTMKSDKLRHPLKLGRAAASNIAFSHGVLTSADVTLAGLIVTKADMTAPNEAEMFDKVGLDKMTLGFSMAYRVDLAQKTATLRDVTIKVDELGALSTTVDLIGVDPKTIAQTLMLRGGVVRYTDASLIGRLLTTAARQSGTDPAAFKKQLAANFRARGAAVLGSSPAAAAATDALLAFLADPRELTVQMAPAQPVPASTLDTLKTLPPQKFFETLGLKMTANQATK